MHIYDYTINCENPNGPPISKEMVAEKNLQEMTSYNKMDNYHDFCTHLC